MTADLVFRPARVAVFVDGCFWHGCPQHFRPARTNSEFWAAKIARNRERDAMADAALAAGNWLSLRFWEHHDPDQAAALVAVEVRARRAAATSDQPIYF